VFGSAIRNPYALVRSKATWFTPICADVRGWRNRSIRGQRCVLWKGRWASRSSRRAMPPRCQDLLRLVVDEALSSRRVCAALRIAQPTGFYAPAQIVRDARDHGVEVRPCVNQRRPPRLHLRRPARRGRRIVLVPRKRDPPRACRSSRSRAKVKSPTASSGRTTSGTVAHDHVSLDGRHEGRGPEGKREHSKDLRPDHRL
jgi:hypothetical protein